MYQRALVMIGGGSNARRMLGDLVPIAARRDSQEATSVQALLSEAARPSAGHSRLPAVFPPGFQGLGEVPEHMYHTIYRRN